MRTDEVPAEKGTNLMILHIIKREIFDHINTLRFLLTFLMLFGLMITNAAVHLRTHTKRVREYHNNITRSHEALKARTQLYDLAQKGPLPLYKSPSPLSFIADGGSHVLDGSIQEEGTWVVNSFGSELKNNWWLSYSTVKPKITDMIPKAPKIDWAFIFSYLLSLIPILFSFDVISGERESGTLRLCLSNPISRHTLLLSKFLGIFIIILIPYTIAVLLNAAIISSDRWTQLDLDAWKCLGIIFLIGCCYIGLFTAIGIGVSASVQESRMSLIILLLIWAMLVVFMPSTLGILSTKWMPHVQTASELQIVTEEKIKQITTNFYDRMDALKKERMAEDLWGNKLLKLLETSPEEARELAEVEYRKESMKELEIKAGRVRKDVEIREHLNRMHFDQQIAQVNRVKMLTRLSPAAIVQYALESMAGTGVNRHLHFLENVENYAKEFRQFIVDMDRSDFQSPHLIGIREGMSKKEIPLQAIPLFKDPSRFGDSFNAALPDLLSLVLLFGVFLSVAFLVFSRVVV